MVSSPPAIPACDRISERGDAVLAVPTAGAPQRGDLLLYDQQDYWVVHRCLGRVKTKDGRVGIRTRGDGRNVSIRFSHPLVRARVAALRRRGAWRSLDGFTARTYALLMAWHDVAWAAAAAAARRVGLESCGGLDRFSRPQLAVPVAFPLFHRRTEPPGAAGAERSV